MGWLLIVLTSLVFVLAVYFTVTCKPGGCSGVPLAFVLFVGVPAFYVGTLLVRGKM